MARKENNWKNWPKRNPFLSVTLLSMAIQFTPKLASSSVEDYLQNNGYPEALSTEFNMTNKRIYGRYNPLSSLHYIGRPYGMLGEVWRDEDGSVWSKSVETVSSPVFSFFSKLAAISEYIPPYRGTNAFAVPSEDRTCFIKPPAKNLQLDDYLRELSGGVDEIDEAGHYHIESDLQELMHALRTFVLAHEIRHCEQPHDFKEASIKESDADIVATRILEQSGYSDAVVNEALKLTAAARIVSSFNENNDSHNTGQSWIHGDVSPVTAYVRDAFRKSASDLVIDLADMLDFPDDIEEDELKYHTAKALLESHVLTQNDALNISDFIAEYVGAYEYLNGVASGLLITRPDYYKQIDPNIFIDFNTTYSQTGKISFKATPTP